MSRSLFLLQKIIFASTSQIYEIFCQIQIFFLTCYTVKLYKCQFYFLMSRISMDFSLFRSESLADKICKF